MLTIEEILATQKERRSKPTQEDLRKLPYKKAFTYGRVSDPSQVRDSKESIREIAKIVALAKSDGYQSYITAEEIENWLLSIQQGIAVEASCETGSSGNRLSDSTGVTWHWKVQVRSFATEKVIFGTYFGYLDDPGHSIPLGRGPGYFAAVPRIMLPTS